MPATGVAYGGFCCLSRIKLLSGLFSLLIISLPSSEAVQSVRLAWDANSEPNIAGYVLHYGKTQGQPTQSLEVGNATTATVSSLADGTTYFFTVTARDTSGLESAPSNEVSYTTSEKGAHKFTVINGTGSGSYTEGTHIRVTADSPVAGQRFDGWIRDWPVLTNPFIETTTALMLSRDLTIEATYSAISENDKIRYYPRAGFSERMVGGVFEGTNGNPVSGTYVPIYTITTNPPPTWSDVSIDLGNFRYLRYRGPNRSYANVAEIEFYRKGVKVTGAGYGTPRSWNGTGATFDKALDANVNTFFDAQTGEGNFVGIDTASPLNDKPLNDKIRYYPRAGFSYRMVGGVFEGTNGNPVSGIYIPIYTITTNPPPTWSDVSVDLGNFRYLRYRGPNGSYGNVAEIVFYRNAVKVNGAGYGTPRSWHDNGNTFENALDGNVNTPFDGNKPNGVYVGIDTGLGAPTATPTPNQAATPANQVTALSFSEGDGTSAADTSGSGHSGTLTNGPTWTAGKFGNALSLDGNNDYIPLANPSTLNFGTSDFTIAAWIQRQAIGIEHTILSKTSDDSWSPGGKEFFVNGNNNTLGFGCFGLGEVFSTKTITNDGLWHHVAVTFVDSSGDVIFYVDGVASGTGSLNTPADVQDHVVKVGGHPAGHHFLGQLDELRIFNRALSPNELQSIMNNAISSPR